MSAVAGVKVRKEVVERLRKKLQSELSGAFTPLVEEPGIKVITALSDDVIESLVKAVLSEAKEPLSWRELKAIFQGVVGEDRLRRILSHLKARGEIAELTRTRYSLPEYVSPSEIQKIKNPEAIRRRSRERELAEEGGSSSYGLQ
ncbi:hypothetical protein JCM10135_10530 [Stetteria hydrogenophila]